MRYLVFTLLLFALGGCGPQGAEVQQAAEVQAVDTPNYPTPVYPSEPDSTAEAEASARAFQQFRTENIARYANRVAGPLSFDSVFRPTPRLDSMWVEIEGVYSRRLSFTTIGFNDSIIIKMQGHGMGGSLALVQINNQQIRTWPATKGWFPTKWTKVILNGKAWWIFELHPYLCNGSECQAKCLLAIDDKSSLYLSELMSTCVYFMPQADSIIYFNTFLIVNYDSDTVPDYYVTSATQYMSLSTKPSTLTLYTFNRNYPQRISRAPVIQFMPYLTFSGQHTFTHHDSVILLRQ